MDLPGFRKKVKALAKQKGCELVGKWEQSMINHMYWCVVSTSSGDSDIMVANALMGSLLDETETRSGLRGVSDIHTHIPIQN